MRNPLRALGTIALAAALAATLAACGSSGSSGSSGSDTTVAGDAKTVASSLTLGGPPECPKRVNCILGLKDTYGVTFGNFKPLDSGGPLTVTAIKDGTVDVGVLFTTNGLIASNGWVLLKDDKTLQPADNVTPVLSTKITDAYPELADLVNPVSAKITTETLTDWNKQTDVDKKDSDAVAQAWLKDNDLLPATKPAAKTGPKIVVGSAAFTESETLANVYADLMSANGYPVEKKLNIGSREVYWPAMTKGEINFLPEYAGTLITFIDKNATATTNADENSTQLAKELKPINLIGFEPSPAQDINGFVVTKETADQYNLANISDLAKPASS